MRVQIESVKFRVHIEHEEVSAPITILVPALVDVVALMSHPWATAGREGLPEKCARKIADAWEYTAERARDEHPDMWHTPLSAPENWKGLFVAQVQAVVESDVLSGHLMLTPPGGYMNHRLTLDTGAVSAEMREALKAIAKLAKGAL